MKFFAGGGYFTYIDLIAWNAIIYRCFLKNYVLPVKAEICLCIIATKRQLLHVGKMLFTFEQKLIILRTRTTRLGYILFKRNQRNYSYK